MSRRISRRYVLQSGLAAATLASTRSLRAQAASANEKINVAFIGAGGKASDNLKSILNSNLANVVALADVDEGMTNRAAEGLVKQNLSKPTVYSDWRAMLDKQHKEIDAVVVTTPDHMHAFATLAAIKLGKHVYCEKPLTHSVWEARQIREATAKYKVATQMGNSGHSTEGTRLLVEWVRAGAVGNVKEVHCWSDRPGTDARPWWPQGMATPSVSSPVPQNLNWDVWLGPAPQRPFTSKWEEVPEPERAGRKGNVYHPFVWRGWCDFGTGALGDMGCHIINASFWALELGFPTSVEAQTSGCNLQSYPLWSIVKYAFPASGNRGPVTLTWYDGGKKPARPEELEAERNLPDNGTLIIGDKGKLLATSGGPPRLIPESRMQEFQRPAPTLARVEGGSAGHHRQWLECCKSGKQPGSNFDHAGRLTEIVLAGNLAIRAGKKIDWDGDKMVAKNAPEVAQWVKREYRKGWTL